MESILHALVIVDYSSNVLLDKFGIFMTTV